MPGREAAALPPLKVLLSAIICRVHGLRRYVDISARARTLLYSKLDRTAVTTPSDDRSPIAQAMDWATRITGLALEMVVPAVIGYWLDTKLGTKFAFLIGGMVLGFITGMRQLIRWSQPGNRPDDDSEKG